MLGQSLTSELESRSKLSGDQDGSQVGQVGIKVESKVRSMLVSIVVKVDIQTKEYNLNCLFKYLKSVAESSSIIIMVPT